MSTQAQYAAKPKAGFVTFNTANTNRDGTGAIAVLVTATPTKGESTRIDRIITEATVSTTAGMVRYYIAKGRPGEIISSITFVGSTATLTTATPHGLSTGMRATLQGVLPDEYNVTDVAITVTGGSIFTYTMGTAPTINATLPFASQPVGYSTTPATPIVALWREIPVSVINASGTVACFTAGMASNSLNDASYLPMVLPAGWSLRVSTNNAETFNAHADGGDTA